MSTCMQVNLLWRQSETGNDQLMRWCLLRSLIRHPSTSGEHRCLRKEHWTFSLLTLAPVSQWFPQSIKGFPGGSVSKASVCNARDPGLIPGLGRSPWRRKWLPAPVFLPGKIPPIRSLTGDSLGSRQRGGHSLVPETPPRPKRQVPHAYRLCLNGAREASAALEKTLRRAVHPEERMPPVRDTSGLTQSSMQQLKLCSISFLQLCDKLPQTEA